MPAPLIILAAWVGEQLASNVESDGWSRIKALVAGDPQVKAVAGALHRSINATVALVANDGSSAVLGEAVLNAFAEYSVYRGSSGAHTVLGTLRSSIDCTLRESGLNSLVPAGSITQLEFLAPGISLERLVSTITAFFVIEIKKMAATTAGSPLKNLSDQLNADDTAERLQQLTDQALSSDDKLDAILELTRQLVDRGSQSDPDQDGLRAQADVIYETLKLINRDYLEAFAEAERLLRSGVASADLICFFETRRAALVAERIEAVARAEQVGNETSALAAFAQAVSAYFDASIGPTRITYFTDLLVHIRDKLQLAHDSQWTGTVRIDDYFSMTSDAGQALLSAIASARVDMKWRFEDVVREFRALDSQKAPPASSSD